MSWGEISFSRLGRHELMFQGGECKSDLLPQILVLTPENPFIITSIPLGQTMFPKQTHRDYLPTLALPESSTECVVHFVRLLLLEQRWTATVPQSRVPEKICQQNHNNSEQMVFSKMCWDVLGNTALYSITGYHNYLKLVSKHKPLSQCLEENFFFLFKLKQT